MPTTKSTEARKLVEVVTVGGTIDKNYSLTTAALYEDQSYFEYISEHLRLQPDWIVTELLRRDSLELDDDDRELIRQHVVGSTADHVVVTHGTDTMVRSCQHLADSPAAGSLSNKTIVFTGAFVPGRFSPFEASFNLGSAFIAAQVLSPGIYIVIGGQVLDARSASKDVENQRFLGG